MSQLLLTGLLACATIAFLYTLAPTHTSCALIRQDHSTLTTSRFGSGLSYSIVYSTLLVKLIFLICLNSGIYLTSAYQAILLFFAVLIQLAIGRKMRFSMLYCSKRSTHGTRKVVCKFTPILQNICKWPFCLTACFPSILKDCSRYPRPGCGPP